MLSTVWILPTLILRICGLVVAHMTRILLVTSFLLSLAYHLGWIHRFLWHTLESELSKILNGTPVTVGSMQVDIIRGKVWISNLVLHSPRRNEWKWQSPVMGRVGKLYVECNLVTCILFEWFLGEEKPLDIYTVEASDIQAFVERKQQIFNFYLMDPHVDVPVPIDEEGETAGAPSARASDIPINTTLRDPTWDLDKAAATLEQEKASRLVDDMVRALGRATQRGSFHDTFKESRDRLTSQLRSLQTTKRKSEVMQEGVKIVQQVSKSLVEKTQNVHQVVVPARREIKNEKIVYGRVGRVVIQDARIFTRDTQQLFGKDNNKGEEVTDDNDNQNNDDDDDTTEASDTTSSWNKPIYIQQVIVRAAELCPPLAAKDHVYNTAAAATSTTTGSKSSPKKDFPAVYQPLDKVLEVIRTRVLTEVAKSNSGRLFQTAIEEVLDYWMTSSDAHNTINVTRQEISRSDST